MSAPVMPAAAMAAFAAAAPSCGAVTGASTPWNAPIGVRFAETMTTLWSALLSDMGDTSLLGGGARRFARALGGLARVGARPQPFLEQRNERIGDLRRRHGLVLAIPVRDPVERAGQGEGRHLHVARVNG